MMTKRMVLGLVGMAGLFLGLRPAQALVLHGIPGGDFSDPYFASGKPEEAFTDQGSWTYYEAGGSEHATVTGTDADRHAELTVGWFTRGCSTWYTDNGTTPTDRGWKISASLKVDYPNGVKYFWLFHPDGSDFLYMRFEGTTVDWYTPTLIGSFTSATGLDTTWRTVTLLYNPLTGQAKGTLGGETVFDVTTSTGQVANKVHFGLFAYNYGQTGTTYFVDNVTSQEAGLRGTVVLGDYVGDAYGAREDVAVRIQFIQGDTVVQTNRVMLDTDGNFVVLTLPPDGTYNLAIKAGSWLRKVVPNVSVSSNGPTNLSGPVTLINGDLDGDNSVTSTDLSDLLDSMDATGD